MDCRPQGTGGRLCRTLQCAMGKEALSFAKRFALRWQYLISRKTDFLGNILTLARQRRI
jgi:hypothetical protein